MERIKSAENILKGLTLVAAILFLITGPAFAAEMQDYCLIPPYVKTDLPPNIMLIMDNSKALGGPIYTWASDGAVTDANVRAFPQCPAADPTYGSIKMALRYDPTKEYLGMFRTNLWYKYSSNKFKPEALEANGGVFDGNLLNFLTTSQYDLMMNILVGGKSTSRQTNVNTLLGYNTGVYGPCSDGTAIDPWDVRVFQYTGTDGGTYICEFTVNEGNRGGLKVSDSSYYRSNFGHVCGLIKATPVRPGAGSFWPVKADASDFIDMPAYAKKDTGNMPGLSMAKNVFSFINTIFDLFSQPAEAVAALKIVTPKATPLTIFNTTLFQDMTPYQCTLQNGTQPYTWSASGLPDGITISASGLISGTPNDESDIGNNAATITLTDSLGATDSVVVRFTVAGSALTITSPTTSLPNASSGVLYNYQCGATGGFGPDLGGTYTWSAPALPALGLSIDPATGLISGTPVVGTGAYTVTISVSDGYVTASVDVILNVIQSVSITAPAGASLPTAGYNAVYTPYTCTASGGVGGYSWSASGLPTGLSINSSTGVISGTPTVMGTFSVTITVTSGTASALTTVTLLVTGVEITWPPDGFNVGDITYNKPYTSKFRPLAKGSISGTYTWSMPGLRPGLSINPATGVISGTANGAFDSGNLYSNILSVTDGVTSASVTVRYYIWPNNDSFFYIINVADGQRIPDAVLGKAYGGFSASTYEGNGQSTYTITGLPTGLDYWQNSGLIYGTPTAAVGCYAVRISVKNASATVTDFRDVNLCITDPGAPAITVPAVDGSSLPVALTNQPYSYTPSATGGATPYNWSATGLPDWPAGLGITAATGRISGTPTSTGSYTITFTVKDSLLTTSNRTVTLEVMDTPSITVPVSGAPLPPATEGTAYTYSAATATGGSTPYTWSATGLPSGLSINSSTGVISGTPANGTAGSGSSGTTYTVVITVTDSNSYEYSVPVTLTVTRTPNPLNFATFDIHICAGNYSLNCDSPGSNLDCDTSQADRDNCEAIGWCNSDNGNACELKSGILQTYWEQARFGLLDFDNSGDPGVDRCPPASPQSSFFTSVENALPIDVVSKLVNAEYMGVHAFMGDLTGSNACESYNDDKYCRKNFILMISNGEGALNPPTPTAGTPNVFGTAPATGTLPASCAGLTYNLAKNACYGYTTDLRPTVTIDGEEAFNGLQNVSTYTVNAMGSNGAVLEQTADYAGGLYYYSADADELKDKIEAALKDIIKRAAAGTAASVLASGEGSGANLIQAIFYPASPKLAKGGIFSEEIRWIGRLSNYWYYVDPFFGSSSIREDTDHDAVLNIVDDYVATFYYDAIAEQTKAELLKDTDGDGYGNTCKFGPGADSAFTSADCDAPAKVFEKLGNLWEAGVELWKRAPGDRTVKTWIDSDSDGVVDSGEFIDFSSANAATLRTYLNLTESLDADADIDNDDADTLIRYVRGEDFSAFGLRSRTVKVDLSNDGDVLDTDVGGVDETVARVWKLGDVLNSTPKIASHLELNAYDKTYNDQTYKDYLQSSVYQNKGTVFAGGNDGMLHAFKLGKLELKDSATCTLGATNSDDTDNGNDKACLSGNDKGKELWSFIPKNVLPYLNYLTDPAYCHVFTVDQTPYLFDASINIDTDTNDDEAGGAQPAECTDSEYWRCVKSKDSWRTIIIGGMRYGGGCRSTSCTGLDCVTIADSDNSNGYSSYFALDVTNENSPTLLWEFSDPQLGFTTGGPSIIRLDARKLDPDDPTKSIKDAVPGSEKNGRWFVLLGSGPTGPNDRDTQQFMGRSDQNLRLFILDLKTGQLIETIDTGIQNAFAGSMFNSTHNIDAPDYQDDVIYIPYVNKCTSTTSICEADTWTDGGVLRLLTREDLDGSNLSGTTGTTALNPGNWVLSKVMEGIGPVTSSVAKLQNQLKDQLWLYFGTGRYFFEKKTGTDDGLKQRNLIGMLDPCFSNGEFIAVCKDSDTGNDPVLSLSGDLEQVNLSSAAGVTTDEDTFGWYLYLDPCVTYSGVAADCDSAYYRPERVITDPLATTSGLVFFTTYKPYTDECSLGGKSYIWALKYDTGAAPGALLKGKAIVQVSTGAIEQIDLETAFTEKTGRRSGSLEGVPPTAQGLSIISSPPPVKRILHMRER